VSMIGGCTGYHNNEIYSFMLMGCRSEGCGIY
jgi:hypothetical protein